MDQTRSRGAYRSRQADAIELGNEPPLSVDGGSSGFVDRRRVSVQWFAGTILTAFAALLSWAAPFSRHSTAKPISRPCPNASKSRCAARSAVGAEKGAHKSDRLPTAEEPTFARQVIRVSTINRVGNHEVVRVRPFVRIAGNLSLTVSDLSANIPPFNPQRLLAESAPGGTTASDDAPAAEPDAEVAFVMRDMAPIMPKLKIALLTPSDEVVARVREAAEWSDKAANHLPVAASITGIKLAYAGDGNVDPYAGFEARIVPENITLLPKTDDADDRRQCLQRKTDRRQEGRKRRQHPARSRRTPADISAIVRVLGPRGFDGGIKEGQKLRVLMAPVLGGQRLQPIRVIVAGEFRDRRRGRARGYREICFGRREKHRHRGRRKLRRQRRRRHLRRSPLSKRLRNRAAQPDSRARSSKTLIRIYSYDVDFQRKVQPGDSFEVLYAGEEETPVADSRNEVLFATLTVGGETKKFYRFQSPDDGLVDYYDETGKSAKKFLVRKPVLAGIMRSGFGLRRHPILGYTKMHTGVDWAAPSGTPIYASGNGVVEKVGWESGYGKYVRIRHTNGYETAYGHMTAFARGIDEDTRVRQGQVIGFVGSTGLSTGSHLHYEILVNGRFVDPMRIKLPRGRVLEGPMLAGFEQERERLDGIMARKPARVASSAPATR